ncbi:hypothetical protein Zmor_026242 [Zophobas morio]|uniref:Uncharacterized protein n=1 Tax=Zophobas morio TaxID=2755281 RepID=A0AA38M573_9CUCU|nr:hypothetical protein Zmor_026242 [Zophobas morio]
MHENANKPNSKKPNSSKYPSISLQRINSNQDKSNILNNSTINNFRSKYNNKVNNSRNNTKINNAPDSTTVTKKISKRINIPLSRISNSSINLANKIINNSKVDNAIFNKINAHTSSREGGNSTNINNVHSFNNNQTMIISQIIKGLTQTRTKNRK